MDREIIIKVIILLVLVILFILRILEIAISVTIIYILLVIAILLVVVIIEIERRQKKGDGGKPGDGEPPTELDDTINELEAKCDLIERLMRGRPQAQRDALAEAKKKVEEAVNGLKRLRRGDRDPNLEGNIQRALREAADKVDQANPGRRNGPLRRLADELRDIERNLF